jgi:hypothetical protein
MKKLLVFSVVVVSFMRMDAQSVNYTYFGQINNLAYAAYDFGYLPTVSNTRNNWYFTPLFPDTLAFRFVENLSNPSSNTKRTMFASTGFTFDPYSLSFDFNYLQGLFSDQNGTCYSYRLDTLWTYIDYRLPQGYNPSSPDTLRFYLTYIDDFNFTINAMSLMIGGTYYALSPRVNYPSPIPAKGAGPIMRAYKRTIDYILTDMDSLLLAPGMVGQRQICVPIPHEFAIPPGAMLEVVAQYFPGYNYNSGDTLEIMTWNGSTFVSQNIKENILSIASWDYNSTTQNYLFDFAGFNTFFLEDKAVRYQVPVTPNEIFCVNNSIYNPTYFLSTAFWMSLSLGYDTAIYTYKSCDYDIRYTTYYASVCPGGVYSDANFTNLTTAGEYHDTLKGINTCDSILCLILTVATIPITNYSAYFCQGKTYSDANFSGLTAPGIYYDTLKGVAVCGDSIVCLTLTYYPTVPITYYSGVICYGTTSYSDGNFTNLTTSGIYRDTLQNINGCDSIVELMLTTYPQIPLTSYSKVLCFGKTYTDTNFVGLSVAGTYRDTLKNAKGCDSIVELTLTAYPKIDTTKYSAIICQNKTFSDANFTNLTQAGYHYKTIVNVHGCDSVIELILTVNPTSVYNYSATICQGKIYNDPVNLNFQNLTQAKQYYDTIKNGNSYGCDSIVCLTLNHYPTVPITNYLANTCPGVPYSDAHFTNLTIADKYYDTLKSINGCDSVICLTLTVNNLPTTNYTGAICWGKTSYSDANFTNLTTLGQHCKTLKAVNGCDSVVCLTLIAHPYINRTDYYGYFCKGGTYSDNNFTNLMQEGQYDIVLPNVYDCDSAVRLQLRYHSNSTGYTYSATICEGESYSDANFTNLTTANTYYDTLKSINGCDSIIELTLIVGTFPDIPTITKNGNILTSSTAYTYKWYFNGVFNGATEQNYTCTQDGNYYVEVGNEYGCTSKSTVLNVKVVGIIEINSGKNSIIIYPNPTDEKLRVTSYELQIEKIEIYDIVGCNVGAYCIRPENKEIEIDISHLSAGMYFLKIDGKVFKVIKN